MAERIIKIDGEEWLLETDENDNVIKRTKLPPAEEAKSDNSKKTESKKSEDSETESKAKAFGKKLRKPLAIAGGVLAGVLAYGAGRKSGKDNADATMWSDGYKAAVKDSASGTSNEETTATEDEALE